MTIRYRIVGTIQIDPLPGGAAPAIGASSAIGALPTCGTGTLEEALLALAVTDAMAEASAGRLRRHWQSRPLAREANLVLPADLAALLAELQSEWYELEIG